MGRGGERGLEHRIGIHKHNLWEMYTRILQCGNRALGNRIVIGMTDIPMEQKWLHASLSLVTPHGSLDASIATMTTAWVNANFAPPPPPEVTMPSSPTRAEANESSKDSLTSTDMEPPRFSCGRNFLSSSDASDIRTFVAQQKKEIMRDIKKGPITAPIIHSSGSTMYSRMSTGSGSRPLSIGTNGSSRERNLLDIAGCSGGDKGGGSRDSLRLCALDVDSVFSSMSELYVDPTTSRPVSLRSDDFMTGVTDEGGAGRGI